MTGALTGTNNGVRLKLHGDDGIFSIETGSSEKFRIAVLMVMLVSELIMSGIGTIRSPYG